MSLTNRFIIKTAASSFITAMAVFSAANAQSNVAGVPIQQNHRSDSNIVVIQDGPVQGFVNGGVSEFLGIPYAAPPVGALRWQPPKSPARWSKPLIATKFGNVCAQLPNADGFNLGTSNTEDCLYLNVFTPGNAAGSSRGGRPVMVWIYGGGLFAGEANDYNTSKLVTQGDVIVVTFNYRLGAFGFFAHSAIDAEHHLVNNYGLMDQQFALKWVQQNIAAFGGNPHNVTIFGQSAGGLSVFANLASPTAKGLFQRAIVESGSYSFPTRSLASAEASGVDIANTVGCSDQTAACLRAVPTDVLNAATSFADNTLAVDGVVLPLSLPAALISGRFNRVPIIDGNNHDELSSEIAIVYDISTGVPATPAQYLATIESTYGSTAAAVLAKYPISGFQSADAALTAVGTDPGWLCTARDADRWISRYAVVYAYEFNDRNAPSYLPPVSFPYGASHTSELQFLFPGWHGGTGLSYPLTPSEQQLSNAMVSYWTRFAASGSPNSPATPYWPQYVSSVNNFQSLNTPYPKTEFNYSSEHNCDFWDTLLNLPNIL